MPTYSPEFLYAVERTLTREGVFSDNAADRGGKTKYGITEAVAKRHGLDVRDLTREQAIEIYQIDYWNACGAVRINSKYIAAELFDTAVLSGPGTAGRLLQTAYNTLFPEYPPLKVDGAIGPISAVAINTKLPKWEKALLNAQNAEQYAFFKQIVAADPTQNTFLRGWVGKRLDVPDDAVEA